MRKPIAELLYEITEDPRVFEPDVRLLSSGILDSYAMIELFSYLEEEGLVLSPTRIDRSLLESVEGIEKLIAEAEGKPRQ